MRLIGDRQPVIISRAELEQAADTQFGYDVFENGDILFCPMAQA